MEHLIHQAGSMSIPICSAAIAPTDGISAASAWLAGSHIRERISARPQWKKASSTSTTIASWAARPSACMRTSTSGSSVG